MLKKKFHSFLSSALDRAERQTLNPRERTAYPRWKGGLHFSRQSKAARGQQVAHETLFAPETFGMKAFYNSFLSEAETEKAD